MVTNKATDQTPVLQPIAAAGTAPSLSSWDRSTPAAFAECMPPGLPSPAGPRHPGPLQVSSVLHGQALHLGLEFRVTHVAVHTG